jgi:acyl-CoA synthetase (AMP-forming)/AMP-acid ligase II
MQLPTWTPIARDAVPIFPALMDYVRHFAQTTPDIEAAVDLGGERLSYRSLAERIYELQAGLLANGFRHGDVVATLAPSSVNAWITLLATIDLGGTWVGLNPRYTLDELRHIVGDANPRFIFAQVQIGEREYSSDLQILQTENDTLKSVFLFGGGRSQFTSVGDLIAWKKAIAPKQIAAHRSLVSPENPCLLVYTSGSTGLPKGALLKQSGLVACSRVQAHHYGAMQSRVLNPLPINHVGWICDTCTTTLVTGGTLVFVEQFDPGAMLAAFGSERITTWGGIPTMFQYMLGHPSMKTADLSHITRILWSGAPMPMPIAEALTSLGLPMHNFYGMTETTGSITFTDPNCSLDIAVNTIGRPEASYSLRMADANTGQVCAIGEVGEIQVKSPGVFHAYLNAPEATAEAFTSDGWFRTGDLAEELPDGNYALRGRLKEMFKSGGYNVYPREIEAVLETMPGVAAACVVAMDDPVFHEVGYAFIVAEPGVELTPPTLDSYAREHLANFKIPKTFKILAELPLLPIGKVDRAALKQMAV